MQSITEKFKAFVASKPRDEAYEYGDSCGCAFAQFLRDSGLATDPGVGGYSWIDLAGGPFHPIPEAIQPSLVRSPATFGALADRLSSIDAKEGAAGA